MSTQPLTPAESVVASELALNTELPTSIGVEGFNIIARQVVAAVRSSIEADALDAFADAIDAYGPASAEHTRGVAFIVRKRRITVRDWLAADSGLSRPTSEEY